MSDVRETLRSEIESRVDTMGSRNILCDPEPHDTPQEGE